MISILTSSLYPKNCDFIFHEFNIIVRKILFIMAPDKYNPNIQIHNRIRNIEFKG